MAAVAGAGPGGSQGSGAPSGPPPWAQGPHGSRVCARRRGCTCAPRTEPGSQQGSAWEGHFLGCWPPRLATEPHSGPSTCLPACPLPPPPAPALSGGVGSWVLHPRGQGCSIGAAADPRAGLAKPVHLRGDAFGVQVTRWPRDTPQLSVNPTALGTLLAQVRHYPPRVFRRDPWGPCCPLSLSKASAYPEGN